MRIISLSSTATEILAAIGVSDLLALTPGRKSNPGQASPASTGQQFTPSVDEVLLSNLKPDLIITDDSVDKVDPQLLQTHDPQPTVINLQFNRLADLFENTLELGNLLDRAPAARDTVTQWKAQFDLIQQHVNAYLTGPTVVILQSTDPLIVAGLWIPELIEMAGATSPLNAPGQPPRIITPDELIACNPDYLLIINNHPDATEEQASSVFTAIPALKAMQNNRLLTLDNPEILNTLGPRLIEGFKFLVHWLAGS